MPSPQPFPVSLGRGADGGGPGLTVRTMRIDEDVDLPSHVPADPSGAWLHHGQGMLGIGCAVRITARGEDRFRVASRRFADLAASARIDDEVETRGTGLVAFGSFSYAAASARESMLVVPTAILGRTGGESFLTLISADGPVQEPASWRDLFPSTPAGSLAEVDVEADQTPDEYQAKVAEVIARIRTGEAEKVVLSATSRVRSGAGPLPVPAVLARLARTYPSTWVYRVGDVIGASPEMLAQTSGGRVFSRVLAGSRPVADGEELPEDDRRLFRRDEKERAEHAFAVESVTDRLGLVAEDIAFSPEPFVLRLPGIEHLASDVSARLRPGVTSLDVAEVLHPSAAVSGTPRERADAIIAELESADRGAYAAPVGWMDARGDGQWAIALRMAHILSDHSWRLQAGGGLVAASDPVLEHAEALAKTRPILSALRAVTVRR
ncbi:MAG: chorismate-binding protein [Brachybacterium sp.]|nr:chorismate-binding protein [Brachybacterium sp.]